MINSRVKVVKENIFPIPYRCKCGADVFRVFILTSGTLGIQCFAGCNESFHLTLEPLPLEIKIIGGAVPTVKGSAG